MFPDMYLQYKHPTIKSQQKPFDKNRQNLIPLYPPPSRQTTTPHTPKKTERTDCQGGRGGRVGRPAAGAARGFTGGRPILGAPALFG